jgi:hypothetical protein
MLLDLNIKQQVSEAISESLNTFFINSLKWIARGIIDNSYLICMITCLLALALYVGGQRKAGKYVSISFVIYFILQSIKVFVK